MATYKIEKEIKEIAELTGQELTEIMKKYEAKEQGGTIVVWGRNDQNRVLENLRDIKADKKAKEIRAERMAGYSWTKIDGQWRVAGNFNGLEAGSTITVVKASGDRQDKIIVKISEDQQSAQVR